MKLGKQQIKLVNNNIGLCQLLCHLINALCGNYTTAQWKKLCGFQLLELKTRQLKT